MKELVLNELHSSTEESFDEHEYIDHEYTAVEQ